MNIAVEVTSPSCFQLTRRLVCPAHKEVLGLALPFSMASLSKHVLCKVNTPPQNLKPGVNLKENNLMLKTLKFT